jgi:phospholipid-binding lipoprotein MlaA
VRVHMKNLKRLAAALITAAILGGCATTGGGNPSDPLEPFNRAMFSFNESVDNAVLKPVATGYRSAVPAVLRTGVSNFFSNLEDVWISANNLAQGKVEDGLGDFLRFAFNSTFGVFGLIDVASDMGLQKHNEDFGQTLGRWGVGSGPYLVLPLLGPSTVRDGLGLVLDVQADPVSNLGHVPTRNSAYATRVVDRRANLLDTTSVLEEAALDKYTFVRDSWTQRRRSLIYDGSPPRAPREDDDEPKRDPSPRSESASGLRAQASVDSETLRLETAR